MDLISVIVPVYGVEKYLDKCISSLVNQTYKNLEIILVDDGSPDSCPVICDSWASRDSRIRVIHQENAGAGAARNSGIDFATGDFVGFVDSDDYVAEDMYEYLHSLFEESVDIAECELIKVSDLDYTFSCESEFVIKTATAEEAMRFSYSGKIFNQLAPVKLFRRSVLEGVRYPVGNSIDDEFFTYRTIANCRNLVHSSRVLYAYVQNPESVMHKPFGKWRLEAVKAQVEKKNFVAERFPALVSFASAKVWQWCLFTGQLALKFGDREQKKFFFDNLDSIIKETPLESSEILAQRGNSKYLLFLAKVSLKFTCKLCNLLNI